MTSIRCRSSLAAARLAAVSILVLPAACSSPNPVLYTVAVAPGTAQGGGPRVVLVQQVAVAHFLERSQIVRSSENYRLDVMENDWWGEPLAPMVNRVLVEELSQRLPGSTVIADNGAVTARPDATVEVNILRLDEDAGGALVLQAQAAVRATRETQPELRDFRFVVPPSGPGTGGEVAAISTAVGRLADGIASMLVSLPVRG
jgi:uncharacterized protein